MKNTNIVTTLIDNVKKDQELLKAVDAKIDTIKEEKSTITDRLKEYRKDMSVLIKYANDEQIAELKGLGFEITESSQGINAVASLAFDIILKAKDNQMTNLEHYEAYKATFKNPDDAFSYTEFNIKCRSLFNTQKLIRKKSDDPKSSKNDIIKLNESLIQKDEKQEDKSEPSKKPVDVKSSKKDSAPVVENKEKTQHKQDPQAKTKANQKITDEK
ncbi:hypothetical protein [Pontimicrobium sp. MEBiC01747]